MDSGDRVAEESAIVNRFPEMPGFRAATTVLLYASAFPEEIKTTPILKLALEAGKRLILPRVNEVERSLTLHEVADFGQSLEPGSRGILEPGPECPQVDPAEVDWVLVPGLAFDRRGFRLGRGAGHYDRLLPKLRPDASTWAIVLTPQWVDTVPIEAHDRPVNGVADSDGFMGR